MYARFSPRRNAEECVSIDTQLRDLEEHAAGQGWKIVARESDPECSGDDEDRPGLWKAVAHLKAKRVLLVWDGSRLARSVFLTEYLHREASKVGARIVLLHGSNDASDEGVMIRQVLSAFDEYTKKINAKRTSRHMQSRQKNGERMSRYAPYGKKIVNGKLANDLHEQRTIERIYELADSGLGAWSIAVRLEYEKVKPRGKQWHESTVKRILAKRPSN